MKVSKTKGMVVLEQIKFDDTLKRKVMKNNDTSGKVTLPKELIGKEVYIIVP